MSINALPNTPSSGAESPNPNPVPQAQPAQSTDATAARRKPSRRANTAERRATHNAVERARRETLNGRFLDLAALLPNLASVRRPSKSAIVNSSIALIHTQRRSRATAGRELRMLKAEADLLRHQLNELRLASGLGGLPEEEPPRSADFIALLNVEEETEVGEDERVAYEMMEGEEDGLDGDDDLADSRYHHMAQQQQALAPQPQQQFAPQSQQHPISRPAVTYDAPAPIYESTNNHSPTSDKLPSNAWNYYPGIPQQQQQQQLWAQHPQATHTALFTPPASSHGINGAPPNPFANQAYVANYRRQAQQEQLQQHYHALNILPSHPQAFAPLGHQTIGNADDDNSSIGSGHDDSSSGSPHNSQGSLPGYDMPVLSSSVSSTSSGSIDGPFAYNPYSRRSSLSIPATTAWAAVNKSVPSLQPAIPHQFATMGLVMQ